MYFAAILALLFIGTWAQVPHENAVRVLDMCTGEVEGVYKDPTDCRRYIYCWKNQAYHFICHKGFVFNPCVEQCVRLNCNQTQICACAYTLGCSEMDDALSQLNLAVDTQHAVDESPSSFQGEVKRLEAQPGGGELESVVNLAPVTDEPVDGTTAEGYLVRVIFNRGSVTKKDGLNELVIEEPEENVKIEDSFVNVTAENATNVEGEELLLNATEVDESLAELLNETFELLNETNANLANETSTEDIIEVLNATSTTETPVESTTELEFTSTEVEAEGTSESPFEVEMNHTVYSNETAAVLNETSFEEFSAEVTEIPPETSNSTFSGEIVWTVYDNGTALSSENSSLILAAVENDTAVMFENKTELSEENSEEISEEKEEKGSDEVFRTDPGIVSKGEENVTNDAEIEDQETLPEVCNMTSLSESMVCNCPNTDANSTASSEQCSHLRCLNGGMYLSLSSGHCGCMCAKGFSGPQCQHIVQKSRCTCANGGKCVLIDVENSTKNVYSCECPLGFLGAYCQYEVGSVLPEKSVKPEEATNRLRDDVIETDLSTLGLCRNQYRCNGIGICVLDYYKNEEKCYCPLEYFGEYCQFYVKR